MPGRDDRNGRGGPQRPVTAPSGVRAGLIVRSSAALDIALRTAVASYVTVPGS